MTLSQQYMAKVYEDMQLCDDQEKLDRYHKLIEKQRLKQQGRDNKAN